MTPRSWLLLVLASALLLATASAAFGSLYTDSEGVPSAAFTEKPYAPYTAGPVVPEVPYAGYTEKPYAPYTAGPVVPEDFRPYAPYPAGPVVPTK